MERDTTGKALPFSMVNVREGFFGGSAGGGKSDALLMAALMYVEHPKYSAIIFRRTYADLALPGAIMDRAHQWLHGTAAKWDGINKQYTFPSGATLAFGYLDSEADKYRYQGAEFCTICWDELTQFSESQYRYLLSRLRKTVDMKIPLRVRAASNPGGDGHQWVLDRFIANARNEHGQTWTEHCSIPLMGSRYWIRDLPTTTDDGRQSKEDRVFIPSTVEDNPHLDASYDAQLQELDPVTRAQLRRGDWSIRPQGNLFKAEWFKVVDSLPTPWLARRHRYWDVATTTQAKGYEWDYTVGAKVALISGDWYIEDIHRFRGKPKKVEDEVLATAALDGHKTEITMEQEPGASGCQIIDHFSRLLVGYVFRADRKGYRKDTETGKTMKFTKAELAKVLSAAAERGRVYLVRASWNRDFLAEALAFPHGAHDDMVDAVGGAMRQLTQKAAPTWDGIDMGEPILQRRM